jgi:UDP-N-acetyl-D-mannosaminuronic acid dehydrogenase
MSTGFQEELQAMAMRIAIVGGCGHVGLPLGIVLAECGFDVTLVDVVAEKVAAVNAGRMPFLEEGGPARLAKALADAKLQATLEQARIADADVVIVIIGTPVDEYLNPRIYDITRVMNQLLPSLNSQQTIILRSTVFPGTTERIRDLLHANGIKASVGFAPERIAQGRALDELRALPQIISAFDERGLDAQREIFGKVAHGQVIELKPLEAELAKLFSNAYRYINFAISNQFFAIAERAGTDFAAIHHAVTYKYPRMGAFAWAGFAAGPCLFKDTMQLAAFSQNTFFLGHAAMLINEGMPSVTVDMLEARLERPVRGTQVGILGMTFKKDNDDTRDSLAFKLRKLLEARGADVICHDPFLDSKTFPDLRLSDLEQVSRRPAVVIGAPHSAYNELTFGPHQVVIDIWR